MSKQKILENEEKPVEKKEIAEFKPINASYKEEKKVISDSVLQLGIVKPVVTVKANKTGKLGVYKFLTLYPQDVYMETLLKYYYPNSFFTKDEWFQRIEDIKNTPILR